MALSVSGISRIITSAASSEMAAVASRQLPPYGPKQTNGTAFPQFRVAPSGAGLYGPDGKLAGLAGAGLSFLRRA